MNIYKIADFIIYIHIILTITLNLLNSDISQIFHVKKIEKKIQKRGKKREEKKQ